MDTISVSAVAGYWLYHMLASEISKSGVFYVLFC